MEIVKKDIKYLNKDFGQFRSNLINFAKNYFPDTYSDFNESSPGMMFIEMASYVGDVLSYYSDQSFRESILNEAQENSSVLKLAQLFGYQSQLNSPARTQLDVYQLLPAIGTGDNAMPDYRYALNINSGMEVTSLAGVDFRSIEPVNFRTSGSNDPIDISVYEIDASGNVQYYLLKKSVPIVSGKVKTATFTFGDPKAYDKIVLPDTNVLDIISIVDNRGNTWNQVDYLAQDTIFDDILNVKFNDEELAEYKSTVPYILKLKRTPRRFIKRLRDDNTFELVFGSGISSDADEELVPNPKNVGMGLEYLSRTTTTNIDPTNFLKTRTYGLAPDNITLTVTYSVGGGISDNAPVNSITSINTVNYNDDATLNQVDLSFVKSSVAINNSEAATGGREKEDIETLRQNAMASFASQNRAITREDYIVRCYSMPRKFGSVSKAYIIGDMQQDSNDTTYPRDTISNPLALNLYTLSYDINKNFISLNPALKENLRTYLSNFRMLTDAINIKTAHIINIGIDFEIIPRPSFNSNEVLLRCINLLKKLFDNDKMQINMPINISNLMTELDKVNGVQSVANFEIVNYYDLTKGYSGNLYDIKTATRNNTIFPSLDPSIFEIKYPNQDIKGKIVKK
jgi:hypothetical protein